MLVKLDSSFTNFSGWKSQTYFELPPPITLKERTKHTAFFPCVFNKQNPTSPTGWKLRSSLTQLWFFRAKNRFREIHSETRESPKKEWHFRTSSLRYSRFETIERGVLSIKTMSFLPKFIHFYLTLLEIHHFFRKNIREHLQQETDDGGLNLLHHHQLKQFFCYLRFAFLVVGTTKIHKKGSE